MHQVVYPLNSKRSDPTFSHSLEVDGIDRLPVNKSLRSASLKLQDMEFKSDNSPQFSSHKFHQLSSE